MKTIIINHHFYNQYKKDFFFFIPVIFEVLSDLEDEYPRFGEWLLRVIDEIPQKKRSIILKTIEKRIVAISIIKHTKREKKISTFRVLSHYQRKGIGSKLMEESLSYLKIDSPIITVSEKRIQPFRPLLTKFKFENTETIKSYYINDINEYIFNGKLEDTQANVFFSRY